MTSKIMIRFDRDSPILAVCIVGFGAVSGCRRPQRRTRCTGFVLPSARSREGFFNFLFLSQVGSGVLVCRIVVTECSGNSALVVLQL